MDSKELAMKICEALSDKKGEDIIMMNVAEKTIVADYFVIASAQSGSQVKALSDNVEEKLEKLGVFVKRIDGKSEGRWIALDYGDVICHIFNDETRLFYHLEKLWADESNTERF